MQNSVLWQQLPAAAAVIAVRQAPEKKSLEFSECTENTVFLKNFLKEE